MRSRAVVPFVAVLVLSIAIGAFPNQLAAQEQQCPPGSAKNPSDPCYGITGLPPVENRNPAVKNEPLWTYTFDFAPNAYIPEAAANAQRPNAVILAQVIEGSLVFRAGPEAYVIVDPHGKPITEIDEQPPVGAAKPEATPRNYDMKKGFVTDSQGVCTTLCAIPPDTFIRLDQGYTIYLPGATTCFWCNATDVKATLKVVAQSGFGFTGLAEADPGLHDVRAWMLNPGSPCHH